MRLVAGVVVLFASGSAAAVAEPPRPADEIEAWNDRDFEGRWVTYRAAPEPTAAWVEFLRARADWSFLEALSITTRGSEALDVLLRADALAWVRCALWRLTSGDSHAIERARSALEVRPGVVLDYLERHPTAATGPGGELLGNLRRRTPPVVRENASRYAPPLAPAFVLAALTPPADVAEWGTETTARPGTVYVHQVERALEAWTRSSLRDEPWTQQVEALLAHRHPSVRRAAALAFASVAPARVPFGVLASLVRARAEPPAVRAAALVGASHGPAIEAHLLLLGVAFDPTHPAFSAAASRLGDVGDELAEHVLELHKPARIASHAATRDDALARIRERLSVEDAAGFAKRVPWMLEHAAVADLSADPFAAVIVPMTKGVIGRRIGEAPVRAAIDALVRGDSGPEDPARRERVRSYAASILASSEVRPR